MAGYPIKSLWGFVLRVVSILVNLLLKLKFRKCLYLSVPLPWERLGEGFHIAWHSSYAVGVPSPNLPHGGGIMSAKLELL